MKSEQFSDLAWPAPLRSPLSVVLIEDDPDDAALFCRRMALVDSPAPTVTVLGTLAAHNELDQLDRGSTSIDADIIFFDVTGPDSSGLDIATRLANLTGAPLVILAGRDDPRIAAVARTEDTVDHLITGEFTVDDLTRTVRHAITRSKADSENRRIAEELRQINHELDQFAGVVAHDIRAPIRTARLFLDRLVAQIDGGIDPSPIADALDRSLDQMEQRIDRLLQIASMRDHTVRPVEESLGAIIDDTRAELLADIDRSEASITWRADGPIFADPMMIRQLLANLLANSIQYRRPDHAPDIVIEVRTTTTSVGLTVTDNGIGVAPRHRDRVFALFERLEAGHSETNLGFGLALCRQIVDVHHGSIAFEDPPGAVGARITVTLPKPRPSSRG